MVTHRRQLAAELVLCSYKNSFDGKARLELVIHRTRRDGNAEAITVDLTVPRCEVSAIAEALRKFIEIERQELTAAAAAIGVGL